MAEADHDSEWKKSLISDFQKALECPICLEVVKKPFKQCTRGHLVCISCLRTFPSCPTCRGELLLENPVCVKKLLECLPRSCCHKVRGCEEMVQEGSDHEKFCGFRHIKCREINCKKFILAKELSEHVTKVHPKLFIIRTNELQSVIWPKYQSNKEFGGLYVSLFNNWFSISLDNNDNEQLKITFESFPTGKMDGDYYAKVMFTKGNIGYVYTLRAFPIEGSEQNSGLYSDKRKVNRAEHFCMKVPKIMLSNFIDNDGDLNLEVFVFKG